jgi:peptidoglycan-N-acetylglucosamine deacetylase
MRRLNEKGRGIILMHDIHPATAMALPILLKELKANGYQVVHVVAVGEQAKVPELTASPATDRSSSPTVLATAPSGEHALTTRRHHRIKKYSANQRHQAQTQQF